MRNPRSLNLELKRQVAEELLGGERRTAQICHRYNMHSSVLWSWQKQQSRGKFNNEPPERAALKDRIVIV